MSSPSRPFRDTLPVFLRLGLTAFGGPVAHLGYFREEFVVRRQWLDEAAYADLVALCQFLPGPASSQVGMAIGLLRGGPRGALAAWLGFTLPSALALILFAYGVLALDPAVLGTGWLHGLKVVAVAVVAQAIAGMARNLCPDPPRASVAVGGAALALLIPGISGQLLTLALGAVVGLTLLQPGASVATDRLAAPLGPRVALLALGAFAVLLLGLPWLADAGRLVALFDAFYRSGALVFGGGHVVLPLLQAEVVNPGWVGPDQFLAGYGAAQAVPGPLFTFSAYLGAVQHPTPNGLLAALVCLLGIFLPGMLLVVGLLPFWHQLRGYTTVRQLLTGVNAAVVGLLAAAFYDPVWRAGILSPADLALGLGAWLLLNQWRVAPWLVVLLTGLGGALFTALDSTF